MNEKNMSILERHAVTLICSLILAAVIWVGMTLTQQNKDMATLTAVTRTQITAIKQVLNDHEQRIRDLEHRRQGLLDTTPLGGG